jgi:hypothetical protein
MVDELEQAACGHSLEGGRATHGDLGYEDVPIDRILQNKT